MNRPVAELVSHLLLESIVLDSLASNRSRADGQWSIEEVVLSWTMAFVPTYGDASSACSIHNGLLPLLGRFVLLSIGLIGRAWRERRRRRGNEALRRDRRRWKFRIRHRQRPEDLLQHIAHDHKRRFHNVLNEPWNNQCSSFTSNPLVRLTNLRFGDESVVSIAQRRTGQAEFLLLLSLLEVFFHQRFGPRVMNSPRFARMADISTVQHKRQCLGLLDTTHGG